MAVGANLGLPSAIIAEFINLNKHEKYAASYYSINNFLSKFSLAIASGIALPILGFMDYQPGIARTDFLFPVTYALLPCFFQIISRPPPPQPLTRNTNNTALWKRCFRGHRPKTSGRFGTCTNREKLSHLSDSERCGSFLRFDFGGFRAFRQGRLPS